MRGVFRVSAFVLSVTFLTLLAGCGPGLVRVKGKITRGGSPLSTSKGERLTILFFPTETTGKKFGTLFAGEEQPDGSFEVPGIYRTGIPPGEYRISVRLLIGHDRDRLKEQFGPINSPILRKVDGKEKNFLIDLDRPTEE